MIELVAAVPPFGRTTTGMSTPRSEPYCETFRHALPAW